MKFRTSGNWAIGVLVAGGILVIVLAAEVLFDPLSWLRNMSAIASIRDDLPAAKKQWQSQEIEKYTIDVEGSIPLACIINATLTVKEGELVAVEDWGTLEREAATGVLIEPEDWDNPFCSYRELLVTAMYARIEQDLAEADWSQDRLEVKFDTEYGYVTEYKYVCCYRRGVLSPVCSDCNTWFSFSNFKPVTAP